MSNQTSPIDSSYSTYSYPYYFPSQGSDYGSSTSSINSQYFSMSSLPESSPAILAADTQVGNIFPTNGVDAIETQHSYSTPSSSPVSPYIPSLLSHQVQPDLPASAPGSPRDETRQQKPSSGPCRRTRRSAAFYKQKCGEGIEDEICGDDLPPLSPDATEEEKTVWKRRHNTLAARRNRKRKAKYSEHLEEKVDAVILEREVWRMRAQALRQLLLSHDIPCPDWSE